MWLKLRAEGQGTKKEVCFAHRILVFYLFSLVFWLMVLYGTIFNVTSKLNVKFSIFFKKFYKVMNVEVLSQDPCQQKEY
jgi:hypothetical protein